MIIKMNINCGPYLNLTKECDKMCHSFQILLLSAEGLKDQWSLNKSNYNKMSFIKDFSYSWFRGLYSL